MPAKDVYHDAVKKALIKDGWSILADPYIALRIMIRTLVIGTPPMNWRCRRKLDSRVKAENLL